MHHVKNSKERTSISITPKNNSRCDNTEVLTVFPCAATNTGDDEVTTPDASDADESKEVSEVSGSIWKGNHAIYHIM